MKLVYILLLSLISTLANYKRMVKLNNSVVYFDKRQNKVKKKKENNKKRKASNKVNESKGQLRPKMITTCKKITKCVRDIGFSYTVFYSRLNRLIKYETLHQTVYFNRKKQHASTIFIWRKRKLYTFCQLCRLTEGFGVF